MTTIADKVAPVKAPGQTRWHPCNWPHCGKMVAHDRWGCVSHWHALPQSLRDRIWHAYLPGQENDMQPSEAYIAVAREVQQWIAQHLAKK